MKIIIENNSGCLKISSDGQGGGVNGYTLIYTLLTVAVDAAKRFGSTKDEAMLGINETLKRIIKEQYGKDLN